VALHSILLSLLKLFRYCKHGPSQTLNYSLCRQSCKLFMDYIEVNFTVQPESTGTEILIALLSEIGYESFDESGEGLKAYIPKKQFIIEDIKELSIFHSDEFKITYSHKEIQNQNWNEVWERNYNPVFIADKVYVRAPFHKANTNVRYELIIEPKMSFGTAHHETTSMMIEMMLKEDFSGRKVLDMGCGTGILSILAEMLQAKRVLAIDNDDWAYQNTVENIRRNNCRKISVVLGNAGFMKDEKFDFILANINRNVLVEEMVTFGRHLVHKAILLLSGFYSEDLEVIEISAKECGLKLDNTQTKNNWIAARFIKSN
jgi:ribosomal protein L11 methyltransferase